MRISRTQSIIALLLCIIGFTGVLQPSSAAANGRSTRGARITVPATSSLPVKLDQKVSAKVAENGEGFTVTFIAPVQVNGTTAIPSGASGAGVVSAAGKQNYSMELNSIFVNGRSYRVTTSPIVFSQNTSYHPGTKLTFNLVLSLSIN
jgi:hypothetical protein